MPRKPRQTRTKGTVPAPARPRPEPPALTMVGIAPLLIMIAAVCGGIIYVALTDDRKAGKPPAPAAPVEAAAPVTTPPAAKPDRLPLFERRIKRLEDRVQRLEHSPEPASLFGWR